MTSHVTAHVDASGWRQYVCSCGWRGQIFPLVNLDMRDAARISRDAHSEPCNAHIDWGTQALPDRLNPGDGDQDHHFPDVPLSERGFGTL